MQAQRRPMLVVWGDRDKILPPSQFAAARQAFPDARTHLFSGCGHMPQTERADEFAALLRDFLCP
jgi:pimeloyl-ACP methyl ester carboxylesterase